MLWNHFALLLALCFCTVWAYDSERVLLRDISAITLYPNRRTTGRRSSPVSQLKCTGGSAGCGAFTPQVVQCKNVGFDGYDVQWECKTDMDDSYRFGRIQVTCEGYDHPDDSYVLRGSCGLEYTIDYTEAGKSRKQDNGWNYGGHQGSSVWSNQESSSSGSWFIFFVIVFAVVFLIHKMSSSNSDPQRHGGTPSPPYPDNHNRGSGNNPPPYGFKPQYTTPPPSYEQTNQGHSATSSAHQTQSPVGGFWSGLGLGSLGGYFFGSRRNNYGYQQRQRGWGWGNSGYGGNTGWGNSGYGGNTGWGNSGYSSNRGWGSSWGSSSATRRSTPSSGSSRTASGFGGTSRR